MVKPLHIICILLLCIFGVFMSGCATPVIHNTPSGRPEVTINRTTRNEVGAQLTNEMLNRGYNITKQTDYMLAFDRPVDNIFAAALLGSRYDSTPNARITYTLTDMNNETRVVADIKIVTNPGSAFERLTNLTHGQDSIKIQELLNQIKYRLEK